MDEKMDEVDKMRLWNALINRSGPIKHLPKYHFRQALTASIRMNVL
jgi:hypothetical protein